MHGTRDARWFTRLPLLLCVECGGRRTSDSAPEPPVDAAPADSRAEGGADGGDCDDPPAPACGGGPNVDPATGIHHACGADVMVNRSVPVAICHHIK